MKISINPHDFIVSKEPLQDCPEVDLEELLNDARRVAEAWWIWWWLVEGLGPVGKIPPGNLGEIDGEHENRSVLWRYFSEYSWNIMG